MKKHSFSIVDDENGRQGYGRFLDVFTRQHYLYDREIILETASDKLGQNIDENQSFDIYVFTSYYGEGIEETFCNALDRFKSINNHFDFYIFDLNLESGKGSVGTAGSFNPTNPVNTCETALKYDPTISPAKATYEQRSVQIAGIEFFNIPDQNEKPKIILSAAVQTKALRSSIQLFENRLKDTFIIDNDPGIYLNDKNTQLSRALNAIDDYLQRKQIAIIYAQSADMVKEMIAIVSSWSADNLQHAASPLIPDVCNGLITSDFWSLQTLFPKQVIQIEKGYRVPENKSAILNILMSDFRSVIAKISIWHDELPKLQSILHQQDFLVSDKSGQEICYNNIINVIDLASCDTVRRSLFKNVTFKANLKSHLETYVLHKQGWAIEVEVSGSVDGEDIVKEFGIFWGQLLYIAEVLVLNAWNYQQATKFKILFEQNPTGDLIIRFEAVSSIPIGISIDDIQQKISRQLPLNDPQVLNSQKLGDVLKIVCLKWKSVFEFWINNDGLKYSSVNCDIEQVKMQSSGKSGIVQNVVCPKLPESWKRN